MTRNATIVAVIGCGRATGTKVGWAIGHDHAAGWLVADPSVRLLGVDPSDENLTAFGERFGLPQENLFASTEAMYAAAQPDFVSVCTWAALHAPMVIEAAERGVRGIVCEKPMARDVGEIRRMRAACDAAGTRLAIAHQRRYDPLFHVARRLIRENAIGEARVLEARVGDDWDMLQWTVHWFDMANFLFDATPISVLAGLDHTGGRRYDHAIENRSVVFAEYPGGRQAIFITGPEKPDDDIVIRGSDGLLRIGATLRVVAESGSTVHEAAALPGGHFAALMSDLIRVAGSTEPMLCGAEQCAIATEVAYAAHESARTMRTVALPMKTQFAPLEVVQRTPRLALPPGRVVLLADDHFGSGGREGLAEALEALTGGAPLVVEPTTTIEKAELAQASLLVLYHTQSAVDSETQAALTAWVEAGRPLVLVHAALGAWPGWEEYGRWACRVWRWGPDGSFHPIEPARLQVQPQAWFRPTWDAAELPIDEVYMKLDETDPAIDVLTAEIPQGTVPAAWLSARHPNVASWMPGHRGDTWTVPATRDGLAHLIRACTRNAGVGSR